jgi:hypothetical protein
MQVGSRVCLIGASVALTVALAACSSDSTAPMPLTSQQVAQDIDQVYAVDLNAGTLDDSAAAYAIVELVEPGPAFGGTEASVTVTTGTGAHTWHGVAFAEYGGADTLFVAALYPNRNLDTMIVIEMETSGGVTQGLVAASTDGLVSGADTTATSVSASVVSASGSCSLQNQLVADSVLSNNFADATCTPATFQFSLSATLPVSTNLGSVSFSNAKISGPLFSLSGPSRVVGIPSRAAALVARLHAVAKRMQ